jgi:hypothetical protein
MVMVIISWLRHLKGSLDFQIKVLRCCNPLPFQCPHKTLYLSIPLNEMKSFHCFPGVGMFHQVTLTWGLQKIASFSWQQRVGYHQLFLAEESHILLFCVCHFTPLFISIISSASVNVCSVPHWALLCMLEWGGDCIALIVNIYSWKDVWRVTYVCKRSSAVWAHFLPILTYCTSLLTDSTIHKVSINSRSCWALWCFFIAWGQAKDAPSLSCPAGSSKSTLIFLLPLSLHLTHC